DAFTITGQHFGDDVLGLVVVIREDGLPAGATTTVTGILNNTPPPPASPIDILHADLDPVGRYFTGELELHVVEYFPLPEGLVIQGPRQYHLSDVRWIASVCHVPGGEVTINPPSPIVPNPPPPPALVSEQGTPAVPPYLLMRDPSTAMNSTVILASDPPPDCATLDLSSGLEPLLATSGFFASVTLRQIEGPPPTPTEFRADLAMAIDQTFAAYGIVALPHPDGVAISYAPAYTGGFAVYFPGGLEP
ncbi:MAG: hypothetical protein AAGE94_22285, partial [Acidobacteriota bacterium]